MKTLEEKLADTEWWKGNQEEPVAPSWFTGTLAEWYARNPYHNLTWYVLGVCDKKFTFTSSHQNMEDPFSPFAKEGENEITLTMEEWTKDETYDLSLWELSQIGLFQRGIYVKSDAIRKIARRAQAAHYLKGHSYRGATWEYYYGWKPGGNMGIAFRKRQKI